MEIARTLAAPDAIASVFTTEQLQAALQFQFEVAGLCENTQVLFAQRVERNRDSFFHEPAGEVFSLLDTARYRVVLETNRDGEYVFLTTYYYFNDDNGTPVPAFIMC